ncbi:MAG: LysR family transcriptional regulator [Bacilli bacterium]|jgi:DNA-binding transcriptional LysR family regulator|nr:LysR family transcriptional regulator [Bacilli bacterium]
MNIKHLDYFREIVDSDFNLSKAAKKLRITQPSLSMLINSWEGTYGVKLFMKSNSRFTGLTKEGEFIYNHSINLLEQHHKFLYELTQLKDGFQGIVRIGVPPMIISMFFQECILTFISQFPNINLEIIEEGTVTLERMLSKGDIDLAILIDPIENKKLIKHNLYSDKLVCIANKDLAIKSKNGVVSVKDLGDKNLVTFNDTFKIHSNIVSLFENNNSKANIVFKSSQWDFIINIVNNTQTYSILPRPLSFGFNENTKSKTAILDIAEKPKWNVVLVTNKEKITKAPAQSLIDFLKHHFANNEFKFQLKN